MNNTINLLQRYQDLHRHFQAVQERHYAPSSPRGKLLLGLVFCPRKSPICNQQHLSSPPPHTSRRAPPPLPAPGAWWSRSGRPHEEGLARTSHCHRPCCGEYDWVHTGRGSWWRGGVRAWAIAALPRRRRGEAKRQLEWEGGRVCRWGAVALSIASSRR